MQPITLITGAGTGIGRALTKNLAERGHHIIAVGRREALLAETQASHPDKIITVAADVSTPEGREQIALRVAEYPALSYVVHNAAVVEPVAFIKDIHLADWRHAQATNVEAPLFLTQCLRPKLRGGRILHISSGVAHFAMAGWAAYCTAKAALFMLYQCLKLELAEEDIAVGSVMPGIADTPMQGLLRETSGMRTDDQAFFRRLHATQRLVPVDTVAAFLSWLLCDISKDEFSAAEWDIYDAKHHARWLQERSLPHFADE